MTWGIVASAGASLIGSAMMSDSADNAAQLQSDATRQANQTAQDQFNAIRSDLSPYRDLGAGSSNMLSQYLGLPQQYTGQRQSLSDIRSQLMANQGPTGQLGTGGAQVYNGQTVENGRVINWVNGQPYEPSVGGDDGNTASGGGLITSYQATPFDSSKLDAEAQKIYDQQQADYGSWQTQQNQIAQSPTFGSLLKNFTGDDLQNEPGYQFGLNQGLQALDRRTASAGNYFSGAALKGAERYGNDYASTKFQDAFNRDAASKTQIYNFLAGGTSTGENAAAQTGNAGMNMAQQVGANTTANATAQGAAGIAGANAWNNGLNNTANYYQQNQLLNAVTRGNTGFGSTSNNLAYGPSQNQSMYGLGSSFNQYQSN